MQYPEILSIIDEKIEQLQQARALLLSVPSADSSIERATAQVRAAAAAKSALPPPPMQRKPRRAPRAAQITITPAEPYPVVATTQSKVVAAPAPQHTVVVPSHSPVLSPITVIAAPRQSSPRYRKQTRPQPSALQSFAPATPVAVSAEEAQRQRELKQVAQKTREAAKEGRQEPILSVEYLAQQWLRKGQNSSQRS